ncbi:MAG: cupin fold metalloprotein, WbuC family [Comamonadaceae bacterium]|nr:MAG: cupin fold metalloprotein, WbuC family [Comamonadaceae bacterium]
MKITNFSSAFLDQLTQEAEQSNRFRQHRNIHLNYQDSCQRLFNAIGMDSYIRPHRHLLDPKTECLIAVRGLMTLVTFDEGGRVVECIQFGARMQGGTVPVSVGVELPPSVWHTVIADVPGAILFEVKTGPFNPAQAKEWAVWAPDEGTPEAQKYFTELRVMLANRI